MILFDTLMMALVYLKNYKVSEKFENLKGEISAKFSKNIIKYDFFGIWARNLKFGTAVTFKT